MSEGRYRRALHALLLVLTVAVSLLGCFVIAGSLAALYLLTLKGVHPGDPIFLDAVAPTLTGALVHLADGVLIAAAPFLLRALLRRRDPPGA